MGSQKASFDSDRDPTHVASAALALACVFWGFSFPATQLMLRQAERLLPGGLSVSAELSVSATLNGWRFVVAAMLYSILTWRKQRGLSFREIRGGIVLGLLIATGIFTQMLGMHFVRPSTSSFLTSLTVIFAPLAQAVLLRRPPKLRMWLGVAAATAGVAI